MTLDEIIAGSNMEARCYQGRICNKTVDHFEATPDVVKKNVARSVMINSPTGSGKTAMGLLTARVMQLRHNIGIAWCAMRRNLLTQALEANAELGVGVENLTTISMFDDKPPTRDAAGRPIRMLVMDEAHHDAAASATNVHSVIKPQYVLGLSGTPFRTDKVKLCFQKTIRDCGIRQLVEMGYLSSYHKYVIPRWDVPTVTERYLSEVDRWGKSAFYWRTEAEAVACYEKLLAAGIRVKLLMGDTKGREDILDEFEAGEHQALVNLFVLTEGWDCPSLQTVFVRDSSKGPTIQMAGRVFRKDRVLSYKQVVQSVNTKYAIEKTVAPAHGFVWCEDEWRSVESSDIAERVSMAGITALAMSETSMPAWLTKKNQEIAGRRRGRGGAHAPPAHQF